MNKDKQYVTLQTFIEGFFFEEGGVGSNEDDSDESRENATAISPAMSLRVSWQR